MYKKILSIFIIVIVAISLSGCENFSFSEIYFANIHANVPEEEWTEKIPAHRVQGGKELQQQIADKAKEEFNKYFESKYGAWVKISEMHVLVDFEVETQGSILPIEIKHTPIFSGIVIAECEYKDKKFTVYVDTQNVNPRCYDNFQGDIIIQGLKDYCGTFDDVKPVIVDASIQPRNGMINLYRGFSNLFDLSNMTRVYYDGDMESFLGADGFEGGMTAQCCFVSENGLERGSEVSRIFTDNHVQMYSFKTMEMLEHYDYSTLSIEYYWPYLSGAAITDAVFNDNLRGEPVLYMEPTIEKGNGFYWALPFLNGSFEYDADIEWYQKGMTNLTDWVPEIQKHMTEVKDGKQHNWVKTYNVAKLVTDVYDFPDDYFVSFLQTSSIEGYSSDKQYALCTFDRFDSLEGETTSKKTKELTIVGDYVVVRGNLVDGVWFIVEVTNPK